jgi:tetratricopeptide (TPR) repeat protein
MKATLLLCFLLLQSTDFDSVLREGLVALQKGDMPSAIERLGRAVELKRDSGIAWAALAQARLKIQQIADADKAALESERVGGEQPVVIRALLLYWSGRGNSEAVLRMLRKAVQLSPKQEQTHFELAQTLLSTERFDEAAEALTAGIKELPNSAQLQLALGVARYGQRRFVEAIAAFLRTIELQPDVEQPYVFLGKILDHAGDRLPEIERVTAAFVKQNPDNANANLVFAKILQRKTDVDPSLVEMHLRKAVSSGGTWEAHFELGTILVRKREYAQAADELKAAIKLKADEPAPHYHLARVYDRTGKPEQAAEQRAIHAALTSKNSVDR